MHNNGLNGILADEMGLVTREKTGRENHLTSHLPRYQSTQGKTIQTAALFAHLAMVDPNGPPHLVVAPLSTLNDWVNAVNNWVRF
jgi:SNF2 family DNA or RNA helicase